MRKLPGNRPLQPRAVILTGPGEDYGEFRVMVRDRLEGRSDQQQLGDGAVSAFHNATPTILLFSHFTERKE